MRKKGVGVRTWLVMSSSGDSQVVEAGKHAIMRRTFLPARDLRLLDPLLACPSTILGRDRAIVVNLEHIKAIISAHEILLLNFKDPLVAPFVDDLKRRLPLHYDSLGQQVPGDGGGGMNELLGDVNGVSDHVNCDIHKGPKVLPFEFRALEACLEAACSSLDGETTTLEKQAYPALDELTSKISTLNLERVRSIKSRLVAISGRVQKVRDEIEQLLDDDEDMAEMYLTNKMSSRDLEGVEDIVEDGNTEDIEQKDNEEEVNEEEARFGIFEDIEDLMEFKTKEGTKNSSSVESKNLDVVELEMLLEAYFVQIDSTLNKLSTLREYVDDTEDYINIMLDDKQNQLLQMGVMLSSATLAANFCVVVSGIFGMNIEIDLFLEHINGASPAFFWVTGGSTVGAIVFHLLIMAWCKWQRLLD